MQLNKRWLEELDKIVKDNNLPVFDFFAEETIEFFKKSQSLEERLFYIDSFPFFKIKKIILDIQKGKEKIENLVLLLRNKLKITTQQAENIARAIKEKIFIQTNEIAEENSLKEKIKEKKPEEKKLDPYREPL